MIIKNDPDQFQDYLSDASNYKGSAEALYIPENEPELIELLKSFNGNKIRSTVTGNGTGLTGARVPEGGIIISLEKMNSIIEVAPHKHYARVQPAVILKDLQDFVESKNLFYPPDPTERNCFIGATVATNASGARTFKYGATRNFVIALKVILPDGEIVSIERGKNFASKLRALLITESGKEISFTLPDFKMPDTKNAAGYYCKDNMDLIDIFIGSEGTLGIITEITLKLIVLPKNVLSCVAFFPEEELALNFIDEARSISLADSGHSQNTSDHLSPRALEYFDLNALNFLRPDYPNIPDDAAAAIWFEQDFEENEDVVINSWIELLKKYNCDEELVWFALDKNEQEKFHEFRHAISWKVNELITQRNLRKVGTDVAVPVNHFRFFYNWMKQTVTEANLDYVVYGHFGNCHPHLNMLPKDEEEYIKAKQIYALICEKAAGLGGTISAEHGIGKLKREYLLKMYGEDTIKEMARLKLIFDPEKILNIGNIFDEKYLDTH
jgi:D-lactate dehydrogenase (cytochrome)